MKAKKISDAIGLLDEDIVAPAEKLRTSAAAPKKKTAIWNRRRTWGTLAAAAACIAVICGVALTRQEGDNPSAAGSGDSLQNGADSGLDAGGYSDGSAGSTDGLDAGGYDPGSKDGASPEKVDEAVTGESARILTLAEAKYPEMEKYPNEQDADFYRSYDAWRQQERARADAAVGLDQGVYDFYQSTVEEFLKETDGENRVYSPVNLYMALAMLAQTTDGDSRAQLLELLHTQDTASLRTQANGLWNANYRNDGATTSILANSLWLNQDIDFDQQTVDTLASEYFASVYQGDPASEEMTGALQDWLNEQTGGLLGEMVKKAKLTPDTIMELCSTIYFRAKWDLPFLETNNDTKTFHSPGGDIDAEFMNGSNDTGAFYWGNDYGATRLRFVDDGEMWLILPDDGKTVDDLLTSGEFLEMVSHGEEWENKKSLIVNYSVPKFDVSSDIRLEEGLQALGVTDIFDREKSDFTPLTGGLSQDDLFISKARHAARVQIDEEGCTAAAFTEMLMTGSGMPPEDEMDFILDRPFLFVITSDTGHPLFVGVVNHP